MSLPKWYKRLEYIQSSGTQYFDTGFYPKYNSRVVMDVSGLGAKTGWLFGARNATSATAKQQFGLVRLASSIRADYFGTNKSVSISDTTARSVVERNANVVTAFGQTITNTAVSSGELSYPMYLLSTNSAGTADVGRAAVKLYSCQIYDNGTLVRDFVPCENTSGAVGLWDDVDGKFYGNAGTGAFAAGPVVSVSVDEGEITELEYIQSSGTQYVDTMFKPNQNTRVIMDAEYLGGDVLFCSATTGTSGMFGLQYVSGKLYFYYGTLSGTTTGAITTGQKQRFEMNQNAVLLDGAVLKTNSAQSFQCTYSLPVFCINVGGSISYFSSLKLFAFSVYDNGLLERDYIPAMLANGEVGLYDRVFHEFYRNAGTGEFIAGPPANTVDITPTMTSNTAPAGYTVTASSVHGTYAAWYAFDNVDSTTAIGNRIWHSGAGMPQWIMLQLPEAAKVTFFSVKNRADIDTGKPYGPTAFELQGSNDGTKFTALGAYTASAALGAESLHQVSTPGKYQYYRLYITDTGYTAGSSKYAVVDQIRFYEPLILVPNAPTGFRVLSESGNLVTLEWDATDDALGYRLYRSGQLLADTTETSVSVTVEPFAGAVFTLTAYNENGEGAGAELTYFNAPDDPIPFLVTDRTQQDVAAGNAKGYYSAADLNRVGYSMKYVADRIAKAGVAVSVLPRTDWTDGMWMDTASAAAYLADLSALRKAVSAFSTTPEVPPSMSGLTYEAANNIELILMDVDLVLTYVYVNLLYAGEVFAGEV